MKKENNGIIIEVISKQIKFKEKLNRRLTFIKGDSGTGKTSIVNLIFDKISEDIVINTTLPTMRLDDDNWRTLMKTEKNKILIIDDLSFVEKPEFAAIYKSKCTINNNYIVVIYRGDSFGLDKKSKKFTLKGTGRLAYSSNSVFELLSKGDKYWLEPMFRGEKRTVEESKDIECVITEDSGSGFKFYEALFRDSVPVEHAISGKSTITGDVLRLSKKYRKILVIFDTAAFGCHIEEFYTKCKFKTTSKVLFMSDYECFEELLIRTNLINKLDLVIKEINNLEASANKYLSWEKYFEDLIKRATYNKLYKHTHESKIKGCYLESCSKCNNYKQIKCDGLLSGDKFEALLKGTKYERLLSLRDKE